MNCVEVDLRLQRYFDGELPGPESSKVSNHLFECPSCRSAYHKLQQEMKQLLLEEIPAQDNLGGVRETLAKESRRRGPLHPIPAAPLSIGAALFLAGFLSILMFQGSFTMARSSLDLGASPFPDRPPGTSFLKVEPGSYFFSAAPIHTLLNGGATIGVPDTSFFLLKTPAANVISKGGDFVARVYSRPGGVPPGLQKYLAKDHFSPLLVVSVLRGSAQVYQGEQMAGLEGGSTGVFISNHLQKKKETAIVPASFAPGKGSVRVRLLEEESGQSLEGELWLEDLEGKTVREVLVPQDHPPQGQRLGNLPMGYYLLRVGAPGYGMQALPVQIAGEGESRLEVRLRPEAGIDLILTQPTGKAEDFTIEDARQNPALCPVRIVSKKNQPEVLTIRGLNPGTYRLLYQGKFLASFAVGPGNNSPLHLDIP